MINGVNKNALANQRRELRQRKTISATDTSNAATVKIGAQLFRKYEIRKPFSVCGANG